MQIDGGGLIQLISLWRREFQLDSSSKVAAPKLQSLSYWHTLISMTSLWTHTVAHFTWPFFRSKANNQPLEKFLSLAVSWVKVVKNWTSFLKINWFRNWSFQKMSVTKNVPLKWYSSMKKRIRKIPIISDIENWLWKSEMSEFCNFWQLLLNWPQDLKNFKGLVIHFWPTWRPGRMCDSVLKKWGHTNDHESFK